MGGTVGSPHAEAIPLPDGQAWGVTADDPGSYGASPLNPVRGGNVGSRGRAEQIIAESPSHHGGLPRRCCCRACVLTTKAGSGGSSVRARPVVNGAG